MVNPISSQSIARLRPVGDADQTKSQSGPAVSGQGRGVSSSTSDGVSLSAEAISLPAALTQGPPIDRALIDRIGEAIIEGRYPIKPDLIADALIRDGHDMQF